MSRLTRLFSVFVFTMSLACFGCGGNDGGNGGNGGGGGGDNKQACQDYNSAVEECNEESQATLNCDNYSGDQYPCDISDYFSCLEENGSCEDGTYMPGTSECQGKAQCN